MAAVLSILVWCTIHFYLVYQSYFKVQEWLENVSDHCLISFSITGNYQNVEKKNVMILRLLKRLEAAHENNPSAYWNIVDELKSVASEPQSDKIDPSKWFSYFKDLFSYTTNKPNI